MRSSFRSTSRPASAAEVIAAAAPGFVGPDLYGAVVASADFEQTTRASYDAMAAACAEQWRDDLVAKPWDRAVLGVFAELVGTRPVADVGCGTGRLTGYLHDLGLEVSGIDLSPGMLAMARRDHPGLRFVTGSMLALDLPDASLGGLLAYYSTIHVPDDRLPEVFAEFARVLAPGGHLLLAFQVGDGTRHLTEGLGHAIALDFHRRRPAHVAELASAAGLLVRSQLVREPGEGERTSPA